MSTRISPTQKASESKVGLVMKGNDGNFWIVTKTKNGVKRWIKCKNNNEKEKVYITQQNGDDPYLVRVTEKMINIYTYDKTRDIEHPKKSDYTKHVMTIKNYLNIYPGIDNAKILYGPTYKFKRNGNSILIETSNGEFMYVNGFIATFKLDDKIKKFYSPTGNSHVPYPFAIGEKNTYLLAEKVYLPNELRVTKDPYDEYYDFKNQYSELSKHFKSIKMKVIHSAF